MLSSPPQTALFWYIVFAGATDRTMTVQSAERLLDYIWPGKDAAHILEVVGNPAKQLSEDESIELRDKLRQMLYPEYDALC
jgi:transcriptional regulator of acetoin/glycerol metabolism